MIITVYEVIYQYDAYIGRRWFKSKEMATRCSVNSDGKEKILNTYQFTQETLDLNVHSIRFSDADEITDEEWDIIESFLGEDCYT